MSEEINTSEKRAKKGRFSFTRPELLSEIGHLEDALHDMRDQRDEARADLERRIAHAEQIEEFLMQDAEQRGYRRGVQDAAKVVTEHYQSMCQEHRLLLVNRATAILALLEQPSEPGEKK